MLVQSCLWEIQKRMWSLTCFHNRIISGISNIAFFLSSNFPFMDLSHLWPLTFWPIPVPLTLRPFSISLACLYSVDFRPGGNSSSTPYLMPNFTNSACRRNDITAPRHRPVSGFLYGRKGFGYSPLGSERRRESVYERELASLVFESLTLVFRDANGLGAGFMTAENSELPENVSCCGRAFGIACDE